MTALLVMASVVLSLKKFKRRISTQSTEEMTNTNLGSLTLSKTLSNFSN